MLANFTSQFVLGFLILSPLSLLQGQTEDHNVRLEVIMERGVSASDQQDWGRTLRDAGADSFRMRASRRTDRMKLEQTGKGKEASFKIIARLHPGGKLELPIGSIRISEVGELTDWIIKLKSEGIPDPAKKKLAFGYNAEELVRIHEMLAKPLDFSTRDETAGSIIQKIQKTAGLSFIGSSKGSAYNSDEKVIEELKGLSAGTALAAVLRPLGLVATPAKRSGQFAMSISRSGNVSEHWPVGWPIETAPVKAAPKLMEYLDVAIDDFPLDKTLNAIEGKTKVPFIYNQNSMARHGIDIAKVKVSLPQKRMLYWLVIRRVISQTKPRMVAEIRVDEAGSPFVWISPDRK